MAQESIDARTLKEMLERGERVTVVDVRNGEQYAGGSIPGSVNFDAYDALHAGDEHAMEGLELPEGESLVKPLVDGFSTKRTVSNRGFTCFSTLRASTCPAQPFASSRSSCGGRDMRRSPWRGEWRPGKVSDESSPAGGSSLEMAWNLP